MAGKGMWDMEWRNIKPPSISWVLTLSIEDLSNPYTTCCVYEK